MKKLLWYAIVVFGLSLIAAYSYAQSPVITQPYPSASHNDSGRITTTNTFQSIWPASTNTRGRAGCLVQNISIHTEYIFIGPIASALTATSLQLAANDTFSCNQGGIVLNDQISITGTSTDLYFAVQQ